MTSQYPISRDKLFHSHLAFLKTCSMLFLQVKCSNLLFRLLISRATFTTGLENQLEVNFARARRSSLHLPIKRLGTELAGYAGFWAVCKSPWWDNYLCRRPNIDFKHKGRILQQIKEISTKNIRLQTGSVSNRFRKRYTCDHEFLWNPHTNPVFKEKRIRVDGDSILRSIVFLLLEIINTMATKFCFDGGRGGSTVIYELFVQLRNWI